MEKEKQLIQDLVNVIRTLMIAAEGNNDYECDTQLQEAVSSGELAIRDAEGFLKSNP